MMVGDRLTCNALGRNRLVYRLEHVVPPAVLSALPVRIIVILPRDETFRMRHQSENAARLILQPRDPMRAAVHVTGVEQRGAAILHIRGRFCISRRDEAALCMRDG